MTPSNTDISNAEWQLMRIIWTHPGLTSRQLIDDAQSILPWKEGTIKSLLHRLLQKNLLRQDKTVRPYAYYPTLSQKEALDHSFQDLMQRVCNKQRQMIISQLIADNDLTQADCQDLMQQLRDKLKTAPQVIDCQCPPHQCTCQSHCP
ncbi:CopY/TcrY family copper transport repressor [Facklamia hominis]|uniref:CopY/TcrY family copper transport repressor n=1 Tax=Facklamia hominis CCUG 36813 TaxID=883111 RepID=K1LSH8_9LACT|nr:CopY/TcrY family copper transport repressor [Facklamia hominis]EKB55062.1 CopY/TcrY family copper transport repressor [Facklamia hominis CCUG 36813]PKY92862.1 CopY/TcrY family copper transport repressor [Facklamia hominis]RYC98251.1 CopY/TcrY family copper transport repressor [Facklamia hominis]